MKHCAICLTCGVELLIATRGSELAQWQAKAVLRELETKNQVGSSELLITTTAGDRDVTSSLSEIGGKGVFVKEVQAAVLSGAADVAVHSAKDLPAQTPEGLTIGAVLKRGDPRDALVGCRLADLPAGATVATGAPRRKAQLAALRPDLCFVDLRGNIATRLAATSNCHAIVVAVAALNRLGLVEGSRVIEGSKVIDVLETEVFTPQVGQGVIAVECRSDDETTKELLSTIEHSPTRICLEAERGFLQALGGDCNLPAGAYATLEYASSGDLSSEYDETEAHKAEAHKPTLRLTAFLATPSSIRETITVSLLEAQTAATTGQNLAHSLLAKAASS